MSMTETGFKSNGAQVLRPSCARPRRAGDYPLIKSDERPVARVKFIGNQDDFKGGIIPLFNVLAEVRDRRGQVLVAKDSTVSESGLAELGVEMKIEPACSDLTEGENPSTLDSRPSTDLKLEFSAAQTALLDMIEDGDWVQARSLVEGMAHRLRVLASEQAADAAGVVK